MSNDYFHHELRRDREERKETLRSCVPWRNTINVETIFQDNDNDSKAPLLELLYDICTRLCIENKSVIRTSIL